MATVISPRCAGVAWRAGDKTAALGDSPVRQEARIELIINLRTAKVLDLEMPTALLVRADEVIE
jgi:putative ABC transport system substrate-binding protein